MNVQWVLLPGFDGTGLLLEPIKAAVSGGAEPLVFSYPNDVVHSNDELVNIVCASLPTDKPYVLIAESFSGPIAIQVAQRAMPAPQALVLCASFAVCPLAPILRAVARWSSRVIFRIRPPVWFLRRYMMGENAPDKLIQDFYQTLESVSATVLENRLGLVLRIDVLSNLAALTIPVLYIHGSQDRLLGNRSLRVIQEGCPHIKVETLDAPHLVFQLQPERSVEIIHRFLTDHVEPILGRL